MKAINKKGMTIIEVVVAFAVLSIVALAFITCLNTGLKIMNSAEELRQAAEEISKNNAGINYDGIPSTGGQTYTFAFGAYELEIFASAAEKNGVKVFVP